MRKEIDLRPGQKEFRVTTKVQRNGTWYMGPQVLLNARDAIHAEQVARDHGHVVNEYFPPEERKKW